MDPFVYERGDSVPMDMAHLVSTGDYIATFMVWLSNVVSGGGIEFIAPMQEALNPIKRSAFKVLLWNRWFWNCGSTSVRSRNG